MRYASNNAKRRIIFNRVIIRPLRQTARRAVFLGFFVLSAAAGDFHKQNSRGAIKCISSCCKTRASQV